MYSNMKIELSLFESLLDSCIANGASDIHLTCMEHPVFRIDGDLVSNTQLSIMTPELLEQLLLGGYIKEENDKQVLTDKGETAGGEAKSGRFGAYFIWPEDFTA